jgi:hypothetical protein
MKLISAASHLKAFAKWKVKHGKPEKQGKIAAKGQNGSHQMLKKEKRCLR